MKSENQSEITPAPEPRKSIGDKTTELAARKNELLGMINSATDGDNKVKMQEEVTIIDRKLRWYAGRSGEGKQVKAPRPTQPKGSRSSKKPKTEPSVPTPPVPAANEV